MEVSQGLKGEEGGKGGEKGRKGTIASPPTVGADPPCLPVSLGMYGMQLVRYCSGRHGGLPLHVA